jgi:nucleotide-binding universal stress UspA family protein
MAYRTILVSLGIDPQAGKRLEAAAQIAHRHQARLLGFFSSTWSDVYVLEKHVGGRDHAEAALRKYTEQCRVDFEKVCTATQIAGLFHRSEKPMRKTEALAGATLTADLCIVSRSEHAGLDEGDLFSMLPENTVLAASCPVLVLPDESSPVVGKRVLVAWKKTKEAARALRDALPVLHKAEAVIVIAAGQENEENPLAPVEGFLRAHHIHAECYRDASEDTKAGEAILSQARLLRCDTVVMGAYGHARFRELLIGGATRYVLQNTTVSLLMSH